jgi:hypothetical protein
MQPTKELPTKQDDPLSLAQEFLRRMGSEAARTSSQDYDVEAQRKPRERSEMPAT